MMRRLPVCILSILFIISLLPSLAQAPALRFDTLTWDFGTVAEAGGRVTHRFGFANRSGRPVVVTDAVATCGCYGSGLFETSRAAGRALRDRRDVRSDEPARTVRQGCFGLHVGERRPDPVAHYGAGDARANAASRSSIPAIWAEGCGLRRRAMPSDTSGTRSRSAARSAWSTCRRNRSN